MVAVAAQYQTNGVDGRRRTSRRHGRDRGGQLSEYEMIRAANACVIVTARRVGRR